MLGYLRAMWIVLTHKKVLDPNEIVIQAPYDGTVEYIRGYTDCIHDIKKLIKDK